MFDEQDLARRRTDDHLVCRGYLLEPFPPDSTLPVVDACLDCNRRFGATEDRLRNRLVLTIRDPAGRYSNLVGRAIRARLRDRRHYWPAIGLTRAASGLVFPRRAQLIPRREIEEVFYWKFVRGAFWLIEGRRMPLVPFAAGLLAASQFDALAESLVGAQVHAYGREREFRASGGARRRDRESQRWAFMLCGEIGIGVWTGAEVEGAPRAFAKGGIEGGNPDSF